MTPDDLHFLRTSAGQNLLTELHTADLSTANLLPLITRLRQRFTQQEVSAAVSMAQLRQKAAGKFGDDAHRLFFTAAALEQASDPHIRQYRADQVANKTILDVCCGIGTDSIAFARAGATVRGIDLDPVRVEIARHNAAVLGLTIQFDVADAMGELNTADYDLVFFDPARRDQQGKRIYHVDHYEPPLTLIRDWDTRQLMVKASPGIDLGQLADVDVGVEFISVGGDLKEAVLHRPASQSLTATLIQDDETVLSWSNEGIHPDVPLAAPSGWLCEPDPAILRAALVEHVTGACNGWMLDETIAYFCTETFPDSPWVRAWRVREWLPFQLKRLRSRLRAMDVGTVTVKKRGSPITPEELTGKLKLKGEHSATVVLTRYAGQPIAIICDDIRVP